MLLGVAVKVIFVEEPEQIVALPAIVAVSGCLTVTIN
jgi:hypothetical protein